MRNPPPKKQLGQGLGPRRINGAMMDVATTAYFLGTTPKAVRTKIERRLIPVRRCGGRIVIIRHELEEFMNALEGCPLEEALANVKERNALV
jgi:hypothetical protein